MHCTDTLMNTFVLDEVICSYLLCHNALEGHVLFVPWRGTGAVWVEGTYSSAALEKSVEWSLLAPWKLVHAHVHTGRHATGKFDTGCEQR